MSDSILSPSALTSTPVSAKKVSSVCAIEASIFTFILFQCLKVFYMD